MNLNSVGDKACLKEDAISLKYCMEYLLVILRYARVWPAESFSLFKTLLSTGVTLVFILINFLLLLSEIIVLMMTNDLKLFANIIACINMHAVGLIKWCYCIRKNRGIIDIVEKLEKCHVFCQRINNSEKGYQIYRSEMEKARKYSNFFALCWLFACIYGTLHWCANPLLLKWAPDQINSINHTLKTKMLPFIGWYPLNIDNNYVCLYLMQIIGGISSALGIVCYDAFYIIMLIIIGAQFQYINIALRKIDFDKAPEAIFILESRLKNCVDCHTEIIKFLQMLQTFTGPIMFVQCIETLTILCLVSFEASVIKIAVRIILQSVRRDAYLMHSNALYTQCCHLNYQTTMFYTRQFDMESILKLWSLFEYFLAASCQLYFFCFFATRLQHLGLEIAYSGYFCGWEFVLFGKKEQMDFGKRVTHRNINRLAQIIMVQAQRPIILTGGPFYILSLETFRVIMSMAMSTCVMLRTVSDTVE